MSKKKLKFIDLFAGMGGFRIAFEKAGCKCVFSSEIDKNAVETYSLNFNEVPAGDITKIDERNIPDHDILCAGFPCQAFSIAGKRLGFEDTRGTLFFDVARILKEKRPLAFFLENVKGLTNHDGGKTLKVILSTLEDIGYNYRFEVLNAKNYNVPQHRERWYCVGVRKDSGISLQEFSFPKRVKLTNTVDKIILPREEVSADYNCTKTCERNVNFWVKEKGINVGNTTLAYEIRKSKCQFKNDGISPCLTAKMGTGGNNVPVVVSQMRKLTEKECLAIMGYPDWYRLNNGYHSYKQIGNSVVVPIVCLIAKELVELIEKEN